MLVFLKAVVIAQRIAILPLFIGVLTATTTYIGGRFALRWQRHIHWLLGFGAGAVLGVAVFDLMPEALHLCAAGFGVPRVVGLIAVGFTICLALYRLMPAHEHKPASGVQDPALPPEVDSPSRDNLQLTVSLPGASWRNLIGAGGLAIHSMLDGIGIGLALKVSLTVGTIAAIGVLIHDFADGINTVGIVLRNRGDEKSANRWLIVDSVAPLAGIACTYLFTLSESALGGTLAVFCGLFLYIGGFDLLPEGYRRHTRLAATLLAVFGVTSVYVAVALARQ